MRTAAFYCAIAVTAPDGARAHMPCGSGSVTTSAEQRSANLSPKRQRGTGEAQF
jgi:hypothetical protein